VHCLNVKHFSRDDGQVITQLIFLCRPLTSKVRLSIEHTEVRWVKIDEAKTILTPFFHREVDIFQQIFQGKGL
jgi:8-oxo-dGTP pyrophosphatase MutT (NUDIX family)